MVRIKFLTGPHAGKESVPPNHLKPAGFFMEMVRNKWEWEIDYSHTTREEAVAWGAADLMARAIRAVSEGRCARFLGVEYTTMDELQAFEDAIVGSGYEIRIASDDHNGLEVHTIQPE